VAEGGKADWEIRLEKYFEKPVAEAKVDKTLSGSQLQSLLIDIERTVASAKKFLAANMISEVRTELDKLRGLLKVLEKSSPVSVDLIVSLLKAGVSEKVLKEIYGVTDEEIQKAKRLLEAMGRGPRDKYFKSIVPAEEWRKMTNEEVLQSIDVATRTLKGRTLTKDEKKYAAELSKDLINIATGESSPPEPEKGGESEESLSSENPSESPELEVVKETVSFPSIKELAKVGAVQNG
jgi:signal transduction histidine kinase